MLSNWTTSYGYGVDKEDGWNKRYYFTYYTTLGPMDYTTVTFEVILYVVILIASVLANVTVIMLVLRRKEIQTVTNCFIVNLAIADLIFALSIPPLIISRMHPFWCLGEAVCKLLPYSQFVCGSVLLWTLTLISVDRLRCLTTSPYYEGIKHNHAIIISLLTWLFNILIHIPVAIFFKEQEIFENIAPKKDYQRVVYARFFSLEQKPKINNVSICTLVFPASSTNNFALMFTLPTTVISCIIPMFILIVNYHKIFTELERIRKRLEEKAGCNVDVANKKIRDSVVTIASHLMSSINSPKSGPSPSPTIKKVPSSACLQRLIKHKKSVRFLYFNVITVLLMWLPMPIIMFLIYFDGHRLDTNYFLSTTDFRVCVIFALANTIVNPIFYGFLTENFKKNIKQWFSTKRTVPISEDLAENGNINSSSRSERVMFH